MKKDSYITAIIWIVLALFAFFMTSFAIINFERTRADILSSAGFECHGEFWTLDKFTTDVNGTDHYMTGFYDAQENYGAISIKSVVVYAGDNGPIFNDTFDYITFCYNKDLKEIDILEKKSYRY